MGKENVVLDVANSYAYSIKEIVDSLEIKANKKGLYTITSKFDAYNLDLSKLLSFIKENDLELGFGKNYLCDRLATS